MNDGLTVRRLESFGDLFEDGQRFLERNNAAAAAFGERFTLHQLHHQVTTAGRSLETMDDGDVRMAQGREQPRLALEASQAFRVVSDRFGQDLDCHFAAERAVERAVHLAHTAGAQRSDDFVRADTGPGGERHETFRDYNARILCAFGTLPRGRSLRLVPRSSVCWRRPAPRAHRISRWPRCCRSSFFATSFCCQAWWDPLTWHTSALS